MKEIIGKQNDSDKNNLEYIIEGSLTKDPELISEVFNNYFTEIGPKLARKIKKGINPMSYISSNIENPTHSKLGVAFNNVYRRILKLPPQSSASTMYAINNTDSFEVLIRKCTFSFTERLNNCENTIIKCINNSWVLTFDIWSPWNELLFI